MIKIRIATYNIHMGISPFRRRNVLDAIELVLRKTGADILCLQEDLQVDSLTELDIASRCKEVWGNNTFGKTVVHPRGVQGNSIISKFPIQNSKIHSLPCLGAQPRSLLSANIDVGLSQPLAVYCAHFGLSEKQRQMQAAATGEIIQDNSAQGFPVVVAGDFNDWRGRVSHFFQNTLAMKEVRPPHSGKSFRTYPAILPCLSLDRIFFNNMRLYHSFVYSKSARLGTSDHLPFVADFELKML